MQVSVPTTPSRGEACGKLGNRLGGKFCIVLLTAGRVLAVSERKRGVSGSSLERIDEGKVIKRRKKPGSNSLQFPTHNFSIHSPSANLVYAVEVG